MVRRGIDNKTTRSARQGSGLCAVVAAVLALLAPGMAANAEPSSLRANPAGSLSISPTAPAPEDQPIGVQDQAGPPIQASAPAGDQAAAGEGSAESLAEVAPVVAPTKAPAKASMPLGGAAEIDVSATDGDPVNDTSDGGWGLRTALALAAVIGLILLCKAVLLRFASRGGGSLSAQLGVSGRAPSGLLSVLARYPVAKGSTLVLLRLDRRVLLLSQTGQGFTTLAEITDPEEVATLIMRAEDEEGASLTRRFRSMLTQAERDPGLIGEHDAGGGAGTEAPMSPRAATMRFNELVMDSDGADDHADAVGSLRDRLRAMREVTA